MAAEWALDLFLGIQTRPHDDIEIAVPRTAFHEVAAALPEYDRDAMDAGRAWPYADTHDHPALHQTWLRDTRNRALSPRRLP